MSKRKPASGILKNKKWERDVVQSARENHIWLNAFACIRPTQDFLARVGRLVLESLAEPERLIEPEVHLCDHERELILRVNKS